MFAVGAAVIAEVSISVGGSVGVDAATDFVASGLGSAVDT
jgi:hypothetical protein